MTDEDAKNFVLIDPKDFIHLESHSPITFDIKFVVMPNGEVQYTLNNVSPNLYACVADALILIGNAIKQAVNPPQTNG